MVHNARWKTEMTNLKKTSMYPWRKFKKETTDRDGIGWEKPGGRRRGGEQIC